MMTEEQATELGKRAVAAGWKWQPNTITIYKKQFVTVCPNGALVALESGANVWSEATDDDTPDFRDPATLGCLRAQVVALVPGAVDLSTTRGYGASVAVVTWVGSHGEPITPGAIVAASDIWPIEALVACLEAAKAGEL